MNHLLRANSLSMSVSLLLAWCAFFPSILNACTVSGGTYYFPLSSLASTPIDTESFYQQQFGINDIATLKKPSVDIRIKSQTSKNVVLLVDIPNKYANKPVYLIFENKIELEKMDDGNQTYEKKSVFSQSEIKFDPTEKSVLVVKQQHPTQYKLNCEFLSIKTSNEIIANEWRFSVIVKASPSAERKTFAIASIAGESEYCDARSLYVNTIERAKALDAARSDGFYQYQQ